MRIRSTRASMLLKRTPTSTSQLFSTCSRCQLAARRPQLPIATTLCRHPARRRQSAWAQAVSVASNVFSNATSRAASDGNISVDPLRMVAKELKFLTGNIRQLLGSGHPSLDTVAKYYTQAEGKHVRPLIVLLMSRATSLSPKAARYGGQQSATDIDNAISPLSILSDVNPSTPSTNPIAHTQTSYPVGDSEILPSQRRLAEITELIHTASLLHDDVIDHSVSRRGAPSANLEFGNKMAVLAGDFLLSRASVALARLRDAEVTELLATVIANLVEGEFMQLKNTARDEKNPVWTEDAITYYLQKTYLKSASLISKSCRAAALLGSADVPTVDAAYLYGKNLGLAFQLVDDMLDYTISEKELGKPAGADLELGLATAPLLFAWKHNQELGSLVGRKFSQEGDVARARELVLQSDGLEQTRALAEEYANRAINSISSFPDCEAKEGLIDMAIKTLKRRK
ncbi:decaprenyl-diphosphate synthase-like protein subunit 1 [Mollisia scopiformis]|uniref:Decaprenyl-diphosphate synthase-like protein subunit 1 n=1 Tax=Mollisia scopiformis TaxID=149040 RepID=A0A194X588_MOLSC|nr:decaprenyl-diphosphate synthase-like protein subunit 1 [Mollisia scopiformis]KUJ14972.1 decaprenyl-diphosphate synthase-like protein subunit 1 [Mollisia scopiformis]